MGMFDTIIYKETECHLCSKSVTSYQSKSGLCRLKELTPAELLEQSGNELAVFYGYCGDDDWNTGEEKHFNGFKVMPQQPMTVERMEE